ncbi:MAG: M23 family metallopeptidase [Alphaproteobacteria bacterium]|jgi:murein DD-endopeptidase MepM/ murein hydrolase activator NlpD|nr:M23 family metallopeptidase [Alphaproteobacteria bacterium]
MRCSTWRRADSVFRTTLVGLGLLAVGSVAEAAGVRPPAPLEKPLSVEAVPISLWPQGPTSGNIKAGPKASGALVRTLAIGRGDTLMKVMVGAGAARTDAHQAISALSKLQDPRKLKPGQEVTLTFERRAQPGGGPVERLVGVDLKADVEYSVVARRAGDGNFDARSVAERLSVDAVTAAGRIEESLYRAASEAGVPAPIIFDLIRLYSFDIDFQRDIQPGDRFRLLYAVLRDESGQIVKHGDILFAELFVGGQSLPLYRFEVADGDIAYFNHKGESVKKALLKTPVDGARLSSRYGRRRHPILGYTKMHRGLDFAAPRGSPIMAAGDGRIEKAGWNGAYGRYVRVRHNTDYKTAYGHMTRIAKGIRPGRRVKQGQVIGYVGSTGRSTGAHLHYEILRKGRQINPLRLKLPTGRTLKGRTLAAFDKARQGLDARYAATSQPTHLAQGR